MNDRTTYLILTVHYSAQPPVAVHIRWNYGDQHRTRSIDALKLARIMSGETEGEHIDRALFRHGRRDCWASMG